MSLRRLLDTQLAIGPGPHIVSGPFGPGTPEVSEKSPERAPRNRRPQKSRKSAPQSLKESERSLKSDFRTLLRLRDALFRDFWGPVPGCSFQTLFGLFWVPGPKGPADPVWGGADRTTQHTKLRQKNCLKTICITIAALLVQTCVSLGLCFSLFFFPSPTLSQK